MLIGDYTLSFKIKKFKCKSFINSGSLLDANLILIFDTSIFEILVLWSSVWTIKHWISEKHLKFYFCVHRIWEDFDRNDWPEIVQTHLQYKKFGHRSKQIHSVTVELICSNFIRNLFFALQIKEYSIEKRLNLFLHHTEPVMQSLLFFQIVRFCIISRQNYFDIKKEMSKTAFLSSCEIKWRFKIHIKW